MKQWDKFLLQLAAEVDEQVAAADEVQLRERRVPVHVLLGKDEQVSHVLVNPVFPAGLGGEVVGEPFGRQVLGNGGGVNAGPGRGDGRGADVSGENLDTMSFLQRGQSFQQEDRDRVRLLAGGAARHPDPDRLAGRSRAPEEFGDDAFFHLAENRGIPEELRDADQQVVEQRIDLLRRVLEVLHVIGQSVDPVDRHAASDPPVDGAALIEREIMPRVVENQGVDFLYGGFVQPGDRSGVVLRRRGRGRSVEQAVGHGIRRSLIVDEPGGDGTTGHAVKITAGRRLHEDETLLGLDGGDPRRAVTAGAGEHDPDGPLAAGARQGAEKGVDREAMAARGRGLAQPQRILLQGDFAIRWGDVDVTRCDRQAVRDLGDGHRRVPLQEFAEQAVAIRRQMLDDYERLRWYGVGGNAGEEFLESGQATGRRAKADHGYERSGTL